MRNHQGISEDRFMRFDPGMGVVPVREPLGFRYESGTFGPQPQTRSLDAIRPSLRNPKCAGPNPVYAIVMDIGRDEIRPTLNEECCCSVR